MHKNTRNSEHSSLEMETILKFFLCKIHFQGPFFSLRGVKGSLQRDSKLVIFVFTCKESFLTRFNSMCLLHGKKIRQCFKRWVGHNLDHYKEYILADCNYKPSLAENCLHLPSQERAITSAAALKRRRDEACFKTK